MIAIDHVIFVVPDLDLAAELLLDRHGIASLPGGRHPGHGTGNRIVPLDSTYIELMAVVDAEEAAGSAMGRWALEATSATLAPAALCLQTDDIEAVGAAIGDEPLAMTRMRPDGVELAWRLAGLNAMFGPENLPFFIQWQVDPGDHPGIAPVEHPAGEVSIASVEVGAVPWSGLLNDVPGLSITEAPPGMRRVTLRTPGGELAFER